MSSWEEFDPYLPTQKILHKAALQKKMNLFLWYSKLSIVGAYFSRFDSGHISGMKLEIVLLQLQLHFRV